MILESVEHGLLICLTIKENRVTRTKKYTELSATKKIQVDCDLKATNIILQVNQQTHQAEFPQIDSGLAVLVFKQGDDPIDAINKIMSFLSTVVTSRFPSTNNQLRNSSNPRQQATIHDGRVTIKSVQGRQTSFAAAKAVLMANLSSYGSDVLSKDTNSSAQQDAMILYVFEQLSHQVTNCNKVNKDNLLANESLSVEYERYKERDIMNLVVNSSLDINAFVNVNSSVTMIDSVNYVEMCNKCLELEAELNKQHSMIE
nr:hypothetical protein [Tanacetum cinerariifolium]